MECYMTRLKSVLLLLLFTVTIEALYIGNYSYRTGQPANAILGDHKQQNLPSFMNEVAPKKEEDGYTIIGNKLFYYKLSYGWNIQTVNQSTAMANCSILDMVLPDVVTRLKERSLVMGLLSHDISSAHFWTSGLRGADGRWRWTNLDRDMKYRHFEEGLEPSPGDDSVFFHFQLDKESNKTQTISWKGIALDQYVATNVLLCQEKSKLSCYQYKDQRRTYKKLNEF